RLDGGGPILGRDASGNAAAGVNRDGEGSAKRRGVLGDHGGQLEFFHPFGRQGQADQASPVHGHEVDGFGGDLLGRHDEVAFIFAVFVIHQAGHAAVSDVRNGAFNGVKFHAGFLENALSTIEIRGGGVKYVESCPGDQAARTP